jgi:hypothetical protein
MRFSKKRKNTRRVSHARRTSTLSIIDEIDRISRIDDPIMRNLRITQCYFEISQRVAALTGASANWCTFATWASKQAGQTIREEDLIRVFVRLSALYETYSSNKQSGSLSSDRE